MKKIVSLLLLLGFLAQTSVFAQTLPQGTLVLVQPANIIDADDVKTGDSVKFRTVKPVKANGNIVLPQGTEVSARVVKRKNNGLLGIPCELEVGEFKILTQNNDIIHLSGTILDKGEGRYWANVGWIFVFPLLFIKGNDGKFYPNSEYMLYTAEDVNL